MGGGGGGLEGGVVFGGGLSVSRDNSYKFYITTYI